MDTLKNDLSISMTMAAFIGISWYIGIEINFTLFVLFSRWRGLYFWSCALCSWGVILQPLFIILADFGVWDNLTGSITMIYLTWFLMVVPQSWVLYSRLHLIVQRHKLLRGIWVILIFNSVVFSVPTIIIGTIAQATTINPSLKSFNLIWDRIQLTVYFVQETMLSILYIYETRKYLSAKSFLHQRGAASSSTHRDTNNSVFWHLIYMNLMVIILDIVLLGIQYAGLFYLQGAFKPCVYGVKLKVEFLVLNSLIKSTRSRNADATYNYYRNTESHDHTLVAHGSTPGGNSLDQPGHRLGSQRQVDDIDLEPMDRRWPAQGSVSNASSAEADTSISGKPNDKWGSVYNSTRLH
ncbi:b7505ff0-3ab8-4e71-8bc7-f71c3e39f1ea [Sclerotinia trifoliorum]|uniref:B7505ff0-3ab8-4e71-8bc7-f71c3e39f1ea n=1 Tax=Sclerotinia trifoliorum TaxID=28548 RepID=A0A8H2ZKF0_9HELO|nr:b7505ff0-3ab8-4e71-8bc7-f71c3e39f1ea [Sclerotinia trifoliorum]